jgi:hypothetical protein
LFLALSVLLAFAAAAGNNGGGKKRAAPSSLPAEGMCQRARSTAPSSMAPFAAVFANTPPWIMDLMFQTKSMEERLDIAVSWFFASVNTWIVRPTLPKAENHQSDLVKVQSQAKSLVSGVLGHYSHLVGQRFHPCLLSRDEDVAKMAQEVYTHVQTTTTSTLKTSMWHGKRCLRTHVPFCLVVAQA